MSETIAETIVAEEQTVEQTVFNPFEDSSWKDTPIATTEPVQKVDAPEKPIVEEKPQTPTVDFNSYVKEKYGYDNEDALANELAKAKAAPKLEFANDESRKLFEYIKEGKKVEVYDLLQKEMKLERLSTSQIDSPVIAAEIIKTSLQAKYSDLSEDEINRKFETQFQIPPKPNKSYEDSDEEYEEKVRVWEGQKANIEKDMVIEAKIVRKEIESLKSELKLPDIFGAAKEAEPTQEELQKAENLRKAYEADLDNAAKAFNGFNVTAKSEDAELAVAFLPTDAEKAAYREKLFDFDSTEYLGKRWIREDGLVDAQKAMRDLYILENHEAILQKVANEAATKMLEHIIKTRSNLKLDGMGRQTVPEISGDFYKAQADAIWSA